MSLTYSDYKKVGTFREPLMTLADLVRMKKCSYSTLRRRFIETGGHIKIAIRDRQKIYYVKRELLDWFDSIEINSK